MKIIIVLATGMLAIQTLGAQTVMSLHDCMEYAVSNSTKMKIQQADISDAQVARRAAILQAFTPGIAGSTYLYSNFGRTVDPETNTYINSTSLNNGYSVGGSLVLFDGFRAINGMKIAKTAVKMGYTREQQLRDEICLATMQAYYNVAFCTKMSAVLQSFVENARQNLTLVQRQKELGQKGKADVVQMAAELADREYEQVAMENNRKDALLTLKDVMLWPVSEELKVDIAFTEISEAALVDHQGQGASIISNAKEWLPSALLARDKMENARLDWKTAKWHLAPSLELNGGWSTSYYTYPGKEGYVAPSYGSQFRNNGGEYIQLSLSIPIFNRWSRQSDISRKKNEYRRATYQYQQALHDIETEVARALQDLEGAQMAFLQSRKRSDVQEEAFRLNRGKMARGLISAIEYQSASNLYLRAQAQCLDAQLKCLLKESIVKYYKGISYLEQ